MSLNSSWQRKTLALACAFALGLPLAVSAVQAHTLKLAIGEEPTEGFDPMLGWSHGSYLLLHAPLLQQNADMSWSSYLLSDYKTSDDGLTWTLTLKPDLKFSDGSALTADDVVFTFNKAAKSGGKINMGNFEKAVKTSPLQVTITLKAPQSTFPNVLGSLGIVSAKKYNEKTYAKQPIGAGPYRLVSFQPGQQLIVEANPYFAGQHNDFDKLIFVFLNEDAAFAAAKSGDLDVVRITPTAAASAKQLKNLKLWVRPSVENRGLVFPMVKSGKTNAKGFPVGNDITADPAIRKAINVAIDRKVLAEQVMNGYAVPAYTAVEGLPWNNPQAKFADGDKKAAEAILEKAGWHLNADGVREKNGLKAELTLWYTSGDATRTDLAQALRAFIEPLGIRVELKSGSWDAVERVMYSNPTFFGWGSLDPMELYHHYSSNTRGLEWYNPGYYSNPVVDKHLANALNAPTWQAALPHWKAVQFDGKTGASEQADAAWAWLLNIKHTYVANPCVDLGVGAPEIHGSWSLLNNVQTWTYKCAK